MPIWWRAISRDHSQRSDSYFATGSDVFNYTTPQTDLAAPQNVRWDGITPKWDVPTDGSVAHYQLEVYSPVTSRTYNFELEPGIFVSLTENWINYLGEIAYFRVRAITADASRAGDSDWAECEQTYTLPEPLPTPTDLKWDGKSMTWKWTPETEEQDNAYNGVRLELYYAETEDGQPTLVDTIWSYENEYYDWQVLAVGSGWYFFKVCAESGDFALASNSDWSEMSAGYEYEMPDPVAPPSDLRWENSAIFWTASEDDPELVWEYRVTLYYCGEGKEPLEWIDWTWVGSNNGESTLSCVFPTRMMEGYGNGNYMVSIVASSYDASRASNSEAVWSDVFTYVNPHTRLDEPTNLRWEGTTMKWDIPVDTSGISHYMVYFFAANDPDHGYNCSVPVGQFPELSIWDIEDIGSTVCFRVSAVSNNANVVSDSALATCGTNYVYTDPEPLETPANLVYHPATGQLTWDEVENADEYRVDIYYGEDADSVLMPYGRYSAGDANVFFHVENPGVYLFEVQAISYSLSYSDSEAAYYEYHYGADLPALDKPEDLYWGGGDRGGKPGMIFWKHGETDQGVYRICIYQEGISKPIHEMQVRYSAQYRPEYMSEAEFLMQDAGSGTYYFTVQAIGDRINYLNSEVVESPRWTYTRPAASLPTPENPVWRDNIMTWTCSGAEEDYYGVEAEISFSETLTGSRRVVGTYRNTPFVTEIELTDRYMSQNGPGYYWFRVRAISNDITAQTTSDWSVLSEPFHLLKSVEDVNQELENIVPELPDEITEENKAEAAATVAQAVEQVKDMDTNNLANAMAADQSKGSSVEEGGTLALIKELEEQLEATGGATSAINVDEDMAGTFDTNQVSVVGAALNASEDTQTVSLEIGAASEEADINPSLYTSAVQFSMHLADETGEKISTDGGELDIPVRITLPVPANINPAFLVVLHYHADGSYEELHPYVYQESGQWFASFVVTSFSDFALASVTIDAVRADEGVDVTVNFAASLDGTAICAVYDEYGRQLGTEVLNSMTAGEHVLSIRCDGSQAASAKLFVVDGSGVPMYVESPCSLNS